MRAGVADQRARHDALEVRTRVRILADEKWRQVIAHGRDDPPSVSPVMVGAEAASPKPTEPPLASMRTSTFSAVAIVTPDMVMGALSGSATGMASTRRMISGACSRSARMVFVLVSMLRS